MPSAAPDPTALTLALTPHHTLRLVPRAESDPPLAAAVAPRIVAAFERGTGPGLLHLGAVEVDAALPAAFALFRDLARTLVARLCGAPELEAERGAVALPCPTEELSRWAAAAPPFPGAEYLTSEATLALWEATRAAFAAAIEQYDGPVAAWLREQSAVWHLVGRVHFHLAENKGDVERPFAFLATYTTKVSAAARVQHVALGKAIAAYAGDRAALLSLLSPVERAAAASPWTRRLVDSSDVWKPQKWTAAEALSFLREVPALEEAGVVVRVPDWWTGRSRPTVRAQVGSRGPAAGVGLDALLDFSLDVALDGVALSREELVALRKAGSGLVQLRGKWVEVDARSLDEMMARLEAARDEMGAAGGLTLRDALRLLSGSDDRAVTSAWASVEPGPWLGRTLESLRRPEALPALAVSADFTASLRPYQEVGVRWLHFLVELGLGACLADDMGLGKTVQVIALLVARKASRPPQAAPKAARGLPSLLVLPASLLGNWGAELSRFAPSLRVLVAHPSAAAQPARADAANKNKTRPDLDGVDLVLTTYGALSRYGWLGETEWDLVIADEAQAIKNPGTRQSRALKALTARGGRIALTGTPVENRLADLHSLFEFTNPGLLGPRSAFDRAVKRMADDPVRRYAPLRALVAPYILRRLKSDKRVISDLPDKTEVRAFCTLAPAQAALYQHAVEELKKALEEERKKRRNGGDGESIQRRGLVLSSLLRFKQICNHPSQWLGDGRFAPQDSGKHGRLVEIADEVAARQEKLLVFTQFREMTQPIAAWLADAFGQSGLVLHGETPVGARKQLVDRFQGDDTVPFMVLSLKAGGTGLNLTAASHVVHFDRWWNPAVEDQATDRAYRIGQHRNVLVHKFVVRGTLEEKIDALIEDKRAVAGEVVGGADGAAALLSGMGDAELLATVSLDLDRALGE